MKKKLLLTLAVSSLIFGSIGLVTSCEPANGEVEGNKNYEGEGEPDPTLGKNGDTYLDTLTNTTYIGKLNRTLIIMKEAVFQIMHLEKKEIHLLIPQPVINM